MVPIVGNAFVSRYHLLKLLHSFHYTMFFLLNIHELHEIAREILYISAYYCGIGIVLLVLVCDMGNRMLDSMNHHIIRNRKHVIVLNCRIGHG